MGEDKIEKQLTKILCVAICGDDDPCEKAEQCPDMIKARADILLVMAEKNKVLEFQLKCSKSREERLCPDHCGKQLGKKTGCIACDVEYFTKKRIEYENGRS